MNHPNMYRKLYLKHDPEISTENVSNAVSAVKIEEISAKSSETVKTEQNTLTSESEDKKHQTRG